MDSSPQDDASFRDYLGLFLLGAGVLLLELALTRVLSVLVWYHFAFLIVAVALLGFGLSGTLLTVWPRLSRAPLERILQGCGVGFGVSAVLGILVTSRIPFRPFGVLGDWTQILYLGLVFVLLSIPVACAGTAVGTMLSRWPHAAGGIYGADLVGAGLGCLAFPPTISVFGGAGSVIVAALFGCGAVLCFSWRQGAFWQRVFLSALAGIGLGFWGGTRCLSVGSDAAKWVFRVDPGRILHTEWNAFSRIDVIAPASPDDALPVVIVVCILLEVHLLPWIFRIALKWSLAWRMAVAVGLLGVPGVLLGTAFPLGIRRAGERAPDQVPWLWGANGFASVTGSALGLMVAMTFGITALLNTAVAVYSVALAAVLWETRKVDKFKTGDRRVETSGEERPMSVRQRGKI